MTDALGSGHPQGEATGNVGQDVNGQGEQSSGNWEEQAKYFQSEKDKLTTENDRLKGFEEIGRFLESRPDVVKMIDAAVTGQGQPAQQQEPQIELSPEEFDPWEAYNDPSSKSYQFRQQELNSSINNAVGSAVNHYSKRQAAHQGMLNLTNELRGRGFNDEQIKGFVNFTKRNPAEYGLDTVIQMYNTVAEGDANVVPNSGLDGVRNTQNRPALGGILDGNKPQVKSNDDAVWEAVKGSGDKNIW